MNLRLLKRNIVILNSGEVIRKAFETEEFKDALNDKPVGKRKLEISIQSWENTHV